MLWSSICIPQPGAVADTHTHTQRQEKSFSETNTSSSSKPTQIHIQSISSAQNNTLTAVYEQPSSACALKHQLTASSLSEHNHQSLLFKSMKQNASPALCHDACFSGAPGWEDFPEQQFFIPPVVATTEAHNPCPGTDCKAQDLTASSSYQRKPFNNRIDPHLAAFGQAGRRQPEKSRKCGCVDFTIKAEMCFATKIRLGCCHSDAHPSQRSNSHTELVKVDYTDPLLLLLSGQRRFQIRVSILSSGQAAAQICAPAQRFGVETLMDSRWATTELAWTTFPESGVRPSLNVLVSMKSYVTTGEAALLLKPDKPIRSGAGNYHICQWEEVSGYDDSMSPIRTYQVCNVRQPNQNNWLRTDFIPRKGVLRVYVELKFSVRDCASIPNIPGSCKETFNLFYYESEGDTATDTSPLWRENPYVKVDTIAPDESFSLLEAGRINTKVRSFGPLSKAGFYLAFQDLGACMSLISVRVFFKKCSTTIANFAVFPETATGAEATSLVIAPGACVTNAMEVSVPLKLYCNGDGEWMVPVGSCTCVAGFEPSADSTQCQVPSLLAAKRRMRWREGEEEEEEEQKRDNRGGEACISGTFKSKFGEGSCAPCPSNSRTSARGANICPCQNGFYRADSDPPDSACTTIPSAPRNVISSVNETSLSLEWEEPQDTGGRSDLVYNVVCKKCLRDRSPCTRCDDNVDIAPRRLGLRQRKVVVRNLQAHTRYSFEVQAVNGVSGKNPTSPSYSTVNITTNQAAPSAVPTVHLMRSTSDTLSLSWLPPEKPNGVILDYEIKYHERGQPMSHTVTSQHSSAKVEGLRAATPYVVQVRARTVAGYGRYSNPMDFSTSLHSDPQKSVQDQLPLIIGSASAGLVVIVALVVIAVVCLKKQRSGSELEYTEKLQQYISPGVKVYIDPFTYEDPNDAIHEFAKEIDISCVKIEEVIGAGCSLDLYQSLPRSPTSFTLNLLPVGLSCPLFQSSSTVEADLRLFQISSFTPESDQ
ncbi:hypothetical protein PAMP_004600 [Pampus punctatissimus]